MVRVALEPRRNAQLGVAIAGSHIDVVDAVLQQQVERLVCLSLGDITECSRAKQRARAAHEPAVQTGFSGLPYVSSKV